MTMPGVETHVVAQTLLCVECGYNLHTLALDSVCPECGRSIAASIQAAKEREQSPRLPQQSRRWLIAGGCAFLSFLVVAHGMSWSQTVLSALGATPRASTFAVVIGFAALGVCWYFMTRRTLRMPIWMSMASWISRAVMLAAIGYALSYGISVLMYPPRPVPDERNSNLQVLNALATTMGFIWLAILARRIGYRWLMILCILLCFGSAPLLYTGLAERRLISPFWSWPFMTLPDLPIVGPLWNIRWSLNPQGRPQLYFVPAMLWVSLSSLTLLIFGIIFLRQGISKRTLA
jgi:uncharacterized membrane protein (GlpM family)